MCVFVVHLSAVLAIMDKNIYYFTSSIGLIFKMIYQKFNYIYIFYNFNSFLFLAASSRNGYKISTSSFNVSFYEYIREKYKIYF